MVGTMGNRMSANAKGSSAVNPSGTKTNPVEGAGDVVFDSLDQMETGVVGGFSKVGHAIGRGLGSALAAPFASAPAKPK